MNINRLCRALAAICGVAVLPGVALAQPQPALWKCPGNVVTNGGFDSNTVIVGDGSMPPSHTDAWQRAYGSPQLQSGNGCHDPYYISFWGNQTVGEAITEPIALQPGVSYQYSFCARFHRDPDKKPTSVKIVLRASTAVPTGTGCGTGCETVVTTSDITSTGWATFSGCFTVKQKETFLTVSPSNTFTQNDGAYVSWGQVDDICIRPATAPVIDGPATSCVTPATYCVKPPASAPFTWNITNGTFTPVNADGSCVLVTWTNPNVGGSIHVDSMQGTCPLHSDLHVGECPHHQCCDLFKVSLGNTEISSGGMGLTFNLSGAGSATSVKATVLSASHTFQPVNCGGPNGPITATISSPQTMSSQPAGWSSATVPYLNGNQIVWQSPGSNLGDFTFDVNFPPTGSINCNDTITLCVEFEVTFAATPTQPCRTCTVVQCFTIRRCPKCA
jgi:hypothetical protein